MTQTIEYTEALKSVTALPIDQRLALAHAMLESSTDLQSISHSPRPSFERALGLASTTNEAPSDEEIGKWIGEHRMENCK